MGQLISIPQASSLPQSSSMPKSSSMPQASSLPQTQIVSIPGPQGKQGVPGIVDYNIVQGMVQKYGMFCADGSTNCNLPDGRTLTLNNNKVLSITDSNNKNKFSIDMTNNGSSLQFSSYDTNGNANAPLTINDNNTITANTLNVNSIKLGQFTLKNNGNELCFYDTNGTADNNLRMCLSSRTSPWEHGFLVYPNANPTTNWLGIRKDNGTIQSGNGNINFTGQVGINDWRINQVANGTLKFNQKDSNNPVSFDQFGAAYSAFFKDYVENDPNNTWTKTARGQINASL